MAGSVVVVDDDPGFLTLAMRVLEEAGIDVAGTAPDAASALEAAKRLEPSAMLVDVGLPGRDGISLAAELRALPWSPQIVLTSTDRDALAGASVDESILFVPKEELPTAPLRALLFPD